MQAPSTQTHPYSMAYVAELLNVDEVRVEALCPTVGIDPMRDMQTGTLFLSLDDVETLRRALTARPTPQPTGESASPSPSTRLATTSSQAPVAANGVNAMARLSAASSSSPLSRGDLTRIVDAVSSARESILRELSVLLDDKLSGLDELLVELIRSKSENDQLRDEMRRLESTRNDAEEELKRFKPAAFGFYRKEKG